MAILTDRAVVEVLGEGRIPFLDGLLSCDMERPDGPLYGALLTPQGKIVADMVVFREAERVALDVPAVAADDLVRRLMLYRLRAPVTIRRTAEVVLAGAGGPPDPRGALGARAIAAAGSGERTAYDLARTELCIPAATIDFALLEAFPHDANMDVSGGVDFAKGCFVGQEVVSRMKHRGTARRRTVRVAADAPLPPTGTPLTLAGKPVGRLGTVVGTRGLALVRIDRVGAEAEAGEVPVRLSPPDGAPFALGMPPAAGAEA